MKRPWIAAILVLGIALLASASREQQIRTPVKQKIENIEVPKTPVGLITVTNPKSTSKPWFAGGDTNAVSWTKSGGQPDTVKIELRDAGCAGGILTIEENTPNDGSQIWVVPASVPAGPYKIRISGPGVSSCSEQFQIHAVPWKITVPPATWKIGSTQTITWTSNQPGSAMVGLFLIPGSSSSDWIQVKANTPNDGSEPITVPGPAGSYRIMLQAQYLNYGTFEFRGGGPITIVP